jgi:O-antigen ligase
VPAKTPTTKKILNIPLSGSFACITLVTAALISSLFFQKVNAEYFALAGLCLTAAFLISLWHGGTQPSGRQALPLWLTFLFWGWIGVATLLSPATFISLATFWTLAFLPFTALSVLLVVAGNAVLENALTTALFVVIAALATYACVMFFVFESPPRATFANKNNFAAIQMPMVFYAAASATTAKNRAARIFFIALTALFTFTIGIVGSRGVLICLIAGLALVFGLLLKDHWPRKTIATLLATVFISLLASNFSGSGKLVDEAATMLAPSSAGSDRFVIWGASLELAKDTPWHGIGPGLFQMVYPKYRLDEDASAALFVHNDYLQLFIEAGWPAPLLLLAALITLTIVGFSSIFRQHGTRDQRLSLLIPLLGFGAIAGHSLLSFNLFLPPLLIISGILLGLVTRHLTLGQTAESAPTKTCPKPLCVVAIALAIVPVLYFVNTGRGVILHKQSIALYEEGEFSSSLAKLEKAIQASPRADIYHYSQAGIWFQRVVKEGKPPASQELTQALDWLNKAEELNPLRPQIHVIRARIIQNIGHPEISDPANNLAELAQRVEAEYQKALVKDPFHLDARFYLARFLLQQNRLEEGQAVLEEGIGKPYPYDQLSVNYYRLTAEIRRILGDQEGYEDLIARLQETVGKRKNKIPIGQSPAR